MSKVIIYTKTGCPYCKRTTEEFRAQGISFEEINVSVDAEARRTVKEKYGANRVPVVVRDGEVIQIGDKNGMG
ncbi:MAG: glutaredoxin family protein [Desulfotomaculales bacterium]